MKLKFDKYVFWLISLLIIGFYFYQILSLSFDFPFYDDYDVILKFLINWVQSEGFVQKIKLLFNQHNEHRVVFLRLTTLLNYYLEGKVNFKHLIIFGNLGLLLIFIILAKKQVSEKKQNSALMIASIASLLFQFASWDNAFWAMASLQNFWIHTWAILLFYLFFSDFKYRIPLSLISLFMVIFTSGNGFLVLIILFFYLILRKNKQELVVFSAFSLILVFIYFYKYTSNGQATHQSFQIVELLKFAFGFIGALFYLPQFSFISIVVGFLVVALFFYAIFKKYYLQNPFNFSILTFLLITTAVVALSRADRGFEAAVISRYRINSTLLIIFSFLIFIDIFHFAKEKIVLFLFFVFSFAYNIVSFSVYKDRIAQTQENRLSDAWLWKNEGFIFSYPDSAKASFLLKTSEKLGLQNSLLYSQSDFANRESKQIRAKNINDNIEFTYNIDEVKELSSSEILIRGFAKLKDKNLTLKKIYLADKNGKLFVSTLQTRRYDLVAKYKNLDFQDCGFMTILPINTAKSIEKIMICSNSNCYETKIQIK